MTQINKKRFSTTAVSLLLFAAISAVYWQIGGHDFISLDDPQYITENEAVRRGLTIDGVRWAFTSFYAGNWHPLTWLSHMLDVELFGLSPGGHHLVNALLHSANSVLLFLVLHRFTGSLSRSAVVAALFGLHPLHVESVAWAAERKDVLSALFWMLSLYFYAGYVQRPCRNLYLTMLAMYALGLMAKPMLVTLPLVMLLLDFWPAMRLGSSAPGSPDSGDRRDLTALLIEKIPLVLLAAASCAVTVHAQKSAIVTLTNATAVHRAANVLTAYQSYLAQMFLPVDMSVFYPFKYDLPLLQVSGAAFLLCSVSALAIWQRRSRPYLFIGWCWYLITLIPVIGIVQVGMQAKADRYTYIPFIGVFILIVWLISEAAAGWKHRRPALGLAAGIIIAICTLTTLRQLSCWKDSMTLFTHALTVSRKNFIAHVAVGEELERQGRIGEAVTSYKTALTENPFYAVPYGKLGKISYDAGKLDEAIDYYYRELFVSPLSVNTRNNLGIALADKGDLDKAADHFSHALRLKPDFFQAQENLDRVTAMKAGRQ